MIDLQKKLKEVFDSLNSILKGIYRYPFELVNNITRILKFSIRSKITLTYLILYTWVTIITTIFVFGGYYYFNVQKISDNEFLHYQEIQRIIDNTLGNEEELEKALKQLNLSDAEVLIQDHSKETIATTTDHFAIIHYEEIKNSNRIYELIPSISLLTHFIHPRVRIYQQYSIFFFYNVETYITDIFVMAVFMGISYMIGLLFLWPIGSSKTKKVLKPIKQFTKSAQSINAKNLSLRIDVGEAKYELKDLAVTMNGMMNRIEESYVKQQQFVSDVSHELRTPISVINGYANMLDRWGKENPEVLQESIDALKNEASNMGDLVEKLLFLARYDGERIRYEMDYIDLSEIVEEIANETEMIDSKHPINRNILKKLMVKGDSNRIKQVIRIFTDNALKYTKEGGTITIKTFSQDNMAVVSIKDTGIGISKEDIMNIFDRFYRTDKSRTKNTGGYGLGLSIAKIIILQHSGKIVVRSKLGIGSEFRIMLPLSKKL